MNKETIDKLKKILSIPSYTKNEHLLKDVIKKNYLKYFLKEDSKGNMYLQKTTNPYKKSICLIAHLDSIFNYEYSKLIKHNVNKTIKQIDNLLIATDPLNNNEQIVLGADDGSGVFLALDILENTNYNIKVALFVEEECGCLGSSALDVNFFKDCSYCLGFDSIQNNCLSQTVYGTQTFTQAFLEDIEPLLKKHYKILDWNHHPYTDVLPVSKKTGISCFNLPTGNYNIHSKEEYLNLDNFETTYNLVLDIFENLDIEKDYSHEDYFIDENWKLFRI